MAAFSFLNLLIFSIELNKTMLEWVIVFNCESRIIQDSLVLAEDLEQGHEIPQRRVELSAGGPVLVLVMGLEEEVIAAHHRHNAQHFCWAAQLGRGGGNDGPRHLRLHRKLCHLMSHLGDLQVEKISGDAVTFLITQKTFVKRNTNLFSQFVRSGDILIYISLETRILRRQLIFLQCKHFSFKKYRMKWSKKNSKDELFFYYVKRSF